MSVVAIVAVVVSVLLTASRFLNSAKPLWSRLPQPVAVLLPAVVAVIPQVVDAISGSKTALDLVNNAVVAVGLVVVGLFPSREPTTPAK